MAKMKVYGSDKMMVQGQQVREVVAASSQVEAARLTGNSISAFRKYWSETGNQAEMTAALAEPGVIYYRGINDHTGPFSRK